MSRNIEIFTDTDRRKQSSSYRLGLYNILKGKEVSIEWCDMSALFKENAITLKKHTLSVSVIVIGGVRFTHPVEYANIISSPEVVLKISFEPTRPEIDNS